MKNFVVDPVFNIGQTNLQKKNHKACHISHFSLFALFFLLSKVIVSNEGLSLHICICCVMFTMLHFHWFKFHYPRLG